MKGLLFFTLSALALGIGGCALLDWATGVPVEGKEAHGVAPMEAAAPLVEVVLPGAGGLIAALSGLWAAIRGRQWKRAAISTFEAIEAAAKAGKGVRALKNDLAKVHAASGVYDLVHKVVSRYGHAAEQPLQVLPPAPPAPPA